MTPKEQHQLDLPVSDESLSPIFGGQQKPRFLEPFIVLAKHKIRILQVVGIAAVGSLIVALLLPKYYTASAKILPPQQGQSFASAMLDQIGSLAPLIGMAGGKDLLKNPNDLYVAMLHSRTVADDIIDRFSLMQVYGKKLREDARKRLDSLTEIVARKDNVIAISVEDRSQQRAADMANAYIDELEKLTKKLAVTDASKRRLFFEREAKGANDQLAVAEQELKQTEEKTGVFQPDSQTRVMLEGYAELKAQAAAKEVEIQSMRAFATKDNPDLVRTEQELAALHAQIARYEEGHGGSPVGDIALEKVPAKALEYVRKFREVKYRESLLQLLLKQYEIARIDEGRDAAMIQTLDTALPPEKKSWPTIWIVVLFSTILALLVAIAWAFTKEAVERSNEDPQYLAQWQLLKFHLSRWRKRETLGA